MLFCVQVEFVKDKATKEAFDPSLRFAFHVQEKGLQPGYDVSLYAGSGTVDGIRGDHIILSPPYTVSKEEIDIVVKTFSRILHHVVEELGL